MFFAVSLHKERYMNNLNKTFLGSLALITLIATHSSSLAQSNNTSNDQRSQNIILNQANQQVLLDQKDYETIYRTDQVPDTCYRSETQGTRTECHTEYDQQCSTRYEQDCRYVNYPVCTNVPRRVCRTEQRCTTTMDRVCNSQGCRNVPRRTCNPVQQCSTQMDSVCRNESRYECRSVPRQYCQNVPREVCNQVPNVVQVPYACTRPVRVAIGQQIVAQTTAQINVNFINFNEVGATQDTLIASLYNGEITYKSASPATAMFLYQIIGNERSEQVISASEKRITIQLTIKAISIQKLQAVLSSSLTNGKLYSDRVEFSLMGLMDAPLIGQLKIVQSRRYRSDLILFNDAFSTRSIVSQGNTHKLMLNALQMQALYDGYYYVDLSFALDVNAIKNGLINPESLGSMATQRILGRFEGNLN
jgi:hypothetical protein